MGVLSLLAAMLEAPGAYAVCEISQHDVRYVIDGGEVYDRTTDLTWQRCSVGQRWQGDDGCVGVIKQMTWKDAMGHAREKWHVPTKDELSTLVAPACNNPAIDDAAFPDMELNKLWYWSSSEDGASAWYLAFGGGSARTSGRMDLKALRLVRRGR
jgi:hypothetical protein